jgi:hypothetical protein
LTYTPTLRDGLSFGDVCVAPFLHDAYVRSDARTMGMDTMKASFAKRYGIHEDIPYFIPGANIKTGDDWVLAHGSPAQGVALADDCLIETVLGREGEASARTNRRLLFAPLVETSAEEVDDLQQENFGRFPLAADSFFDTPGVVDLRRCFMVQVGDVHDGLKAGDFRVRSLDDVARAELAVRWSAYALRRGPFVAEDSLEKFAEYLIERGVADEDQATTVAQALADLVATTWRFEGTAIEAAGNAASDGADPRQLIDQLKHELGQLQAATGAALHELVASR